MIFVTKLRLHEGRCSPAIIWLCLWFFSIFYCEISQKCHNLWKLSCWSIISQKNRGYQHSFLAFCYFVFSSSISNLVLWIFWLTGTSKDTNMFNDPANLEILPKEKKSYSKDPYFLCHKTICNGIEFYQVQNLSMQRLSNHYNCKVCYYDMSRWCQDSLYPQQTSTNFCLPTIQPTRQVY